MRAPPQATGVAVGQPEVVGGAEPGRQPVGIVHLRPGARPGPVQAQDQAPTATAHAALSSGGGYLAVPNVGVLGSHGAAAVPLAVTLLAWGREGLARRIEHCMDLAAELAERVRSDPGLELFDEPSTGVVLWRPAGADLARVRAELRDAYVSTAVVAGGAWLRSVAANPRADPALVVGSVLAAARHGR